ncbi:MAG: hypothetical protein Q9186_004662 [Xanthomendoza sp. 1 TL-2023]
MAYSNIHPPQLTLLQRLDDPGELQRFVTLLQANPAELRETILELVYGADLLPGTVYPCSKPTPEGILLCLGRCVSPKTDTTFWSENTFVYRAGESPNTQLRSDVLRNPFWGIRKLHVIFGMDDLKNKFALATPDKTNAAEIQLPFLKELEHLESREQGDTTLSPTDILSLNFPCTIKFTSGAIDQFNHLNDVLIHTWLSKIRSASELHLTHITLDFTECRNPITEEQLGNDVAQNLKPFEHGFPEDLVVLPEELKMQLTLHIRDANGLDAK